MKKYVLLSSNQNKLKEFQRYGLENLTCESIPYLREIDSEDPTQVAVFKAKDAGPGYLVEDTSLFIDGASVGTNIKWLPENLDTFAGRECTWMVVLAYNDGDKISVYEGKLGGTIVGNDFADEEVFGFDANFFVPGPNLTLHEMEKHGLKDVDSARKLAVGFLLKDVPHMVFENPESLVWTGSYQP